MAKRVCLEPGCPTITDRARCPVHARAKDRERGTRQERGYDTRHDREAKRVRDLIRAGHLILCWRCGEPITDPDDCHLGHDDRDRSITRGAEHGRACNLRAAGRARHIAPDDQPTRVKGGGWGQAPSTAGPLGRALGGAEGSSIPVQHHP